MTRQDSEIAGLSEPAPGPRGGKLWESVRRHLVIVICVLVVAVAAIIFVVTRPSGPAVSTPLEPVRYVGVYERDAPRTYSGVEQFAQDIGKQPNLVVYYSSWLEPFQVSFASLAAQHGAAPVVQINPANISLAAIAAGRYDTYLKAYALAVRAYGKRVILSFGHEMNGDWFTWGYQHVAPATFVAAWRHIVTVFRGQHAANVTWLWTVNIIATNGGIPAPDRWWPGSAYVNWVGIDGYYYKPAWTFASLFGPTIKNIRTLTRDPILISETGVAPAAGKPAKIANLFAGLRAYGLLGFVWFNAVEVNDWRVNTPAAKAAFRQAARAYPGPAT